MENLHLPFGMPSDKLPVPNKAECLTALSKAEGLRYPPPRPVEFSLCETAKPIQQDKSLQRTTMHASFLGISEALYLEIFHQPPTILSPTGFQNGV